MVWRSILAPKYVVSLIDFKSYLQQHDYETDTGQGYEALPSSLHRGQAVCNVGSSGLCCVTCWLLGYASCTPAQATGVE